MTKIDQDPSALVELDYYSMRNLIGGMEIFRNDLKELYVLLGDFENFLMSPPPKR